MIMETDSSAHNSFSRNYLVLKPSEVGFFGLIRLLWFHDHDHIDLGDIKFVECGSEEEAGKGSVGDDDEYLKDFGSRWLVVLSVVGQVLLLWMKKPMACAGYMLEMWLNLVPCNGGLFNLLLNFITGKVARPDKEGATYRSIIGNLDTRLDLNPTIISSTTAIVDDNNNINNVAFFCIMAAKLSYENSAAIQAVVEHTWQMKLIGSYKFSNDFQRNYTTKASILMQQKERDGEGDLVVVSFKGTAPFDADDWCIDVDMSWYELQGVGKVHGGFMKALGLQRKTGWPKELVNMAQRDEDDQPKPKFAYYTIREKLRSILLENNSKAKAKAKFILTGHSLGGALAILFAAVLLFHDEAQLLDRLQGVYTFGQPRVGDLRFGEFMDKNLKGHDVSYFRYVYCNDLVPRLPYDDHRSIFYKHFGSCLYYNSFYKRQVLTEEPNKNYFSIQWFIAMHINAAWELNRSFILPWIEGPDYKEGWFLRFFRLLGLFVPGLSAHGPQDYDNLTRLSIED
ncbi:hypothetical protein Dimus_004522 [Dionaea muscipula]